MSLSLIFEDVNAKLLHYYYYSLGRAGMRGVRLVSGGGQRHAPVSKHFTVKSECLFSLTYSSVP